MKKSVTIFLAVALMVLGNCSEKTKGSPREAILSKKTGFIDVEKTKLYYEEMGEGQPLIMLHGGLLDRRMWDDQFEVFAQKYRVIRFDVRNHGDSKGAPETFKQYEDLLKVLDQLNIDKAVIMGLSLGGRIAIDFAIAYPNKVAALVLAAPGASGYEFKSEAFQKNDEQLEKAFAEGDVTKAIEYFQRSWTDGPYREPSQVNQTVREKVKAMAAHTLSDWESQSIMKELDPPAIGRLEEIQAPTLAVLGDLDMPGIHEIVDLIQAKVSGAQKVVIPGVAHMVNMEKPEEFNKIVLDFLAKRKL